MRSKIAFVTHGRNRMNEIAKVEVSNVPPLTQIYQLQHIERSKTTVGLVGIKIKIDRINPVIANINNRDTNQAIANNEWQAKDAQDEIVKAIISNG